MSQNLNLLRQNYCRPATMTGKRTLFPLEKECEQGKALLAKAPTALLHLQKFIHTAFNRPIETKLPVRNYRFSPSSTSKATTKSLTKSLRIRFPRSPSLTVCPRHSTSENPGFRKEDQRAQNESRAGGNKDFFHLGIFPVLGYLFAPPRYWPAPRHSSSLYSRSAVGAFLSYLVSLLVLDRFCPWKKLVITAEFDGIFPKEARPDAQPQTISTTSISSSTSNTAGKALSCQIQGRVP